jgi:DNA-binding HxlR family transcriptional regulator
MSDARTAPKSAPDELAMARQPLSPRSCPAAAALRILGERWSLLAIREMTYGVHRFEQIAGYTGASRDILTDRLRKLEGAGVVERRQYSEHPPRFEYHLTAAGEELRPVVLMLGEWGSKWAQDPQTSIVHHECGAQLEMDHVCRHCGETVTAGTTEVYSTQAD